MAKRAAWLWPELATLCNTTRYSRAMPRRATVPNSPLRHGPRPFSRAMPIYRHGGPAARDGPTCSIALSSYSRCPRSNTAAMHTCTPSMSCPPHGHATAV